MATTVMYTCLPALSLHDTLPIYVVVGRRRADADLVGRYVEAGTRGFSRPLQLLDHRRINRSHAHRLEFQTIAENCDLAGILAGIVRVPMVFQALGGFVADGSGCSQNAARIRAICKEPRDRKSTRLNSSH